MEGERQLLDNFKNVLQTLSNSTGLKVNYSKSMLVPINIDTQESVSLAQSFGCSVGSLPFTYLGLPLGLTKPKIIDFLPMVSKCEKKALLHLCFSLPGRQIGSYQLHLHSFAHVLYVYI